MSIFGNQQSAPPPPPAPAMPLPPVQASAAPQAAAAVAGHGKIVITPEMSKALSPKSVVPEEAGTERRGVDPMKLRADNEDVEAMEKMSQSWKKKYGEPEE